MQLYCPLCRQEIPPEDKDVLESPDGQLVAQARCRSCGKVFTICEERQFLKICGPSQRSHPED